MTIQSEKEFDVLGYRLRYRPDIDSSNEATNNSSATINAEEVVEYFNQRANGLRSRYPHLDPGQVATLLALDITKEKLVLEREFKTSLHNLEERTRQALEKIEKADPVGQ
ncbi:MAG: cell division protein ZapA [Bdellovibrio sp.]|nr:cell division protein ZapA [Bdellovibrio sp.]